MACVNVSGNALEYAEAGSGTPIVLVHGSASDHRTWHLQQEALAEHFRVITFSRRHKAVRSLRLEQDASRTRPKEE